MLIFRKKDHCIKADPQSNWDTCFMIQHNRVYMGSGSWDSWKEIKYSGRKVVTDRILYETSEGWIEEANLRFPKCRDLP